MVQMKGIVVHCKLDAAVVLNNLTIKKMGNTPWSRQIMEKYFL